MTTATYQALLECNHSKAHDFKNEREGKMIEMGVRNETHFQSENLLHLCFAEQCLHTARHQEVLGVTKPLRLLDGVKEPVHYQHGQKELPAAYRLGETPGG